MATYDDILTLGIYYGLLPFAALLGLVFYTSINRFRKRRWVFLDMQLRSGPSFRKQYPVKKGVVLTKKHGAYAVPMEGQSGTFKGKPLYRLYEGYPYPIVYTHDQVPVWEVKKVKGPDGKENMQNVVTGTQEIVKPLPLAPSSFRFSTYERDRTHAQVYGGGGKLEILLLVSVIIGVLVLLVVLAK